MRIALLSDRHGNRIALDAVLHDIETQGGVDAYWVLGDLAAIGPQPVQVLERISQLPNVRVTRGNADRYTVTGERPSPTAEEVIANPALLPVFAEVAHTFAWTQGCLAATGWLKYLEDLPLEQYFQLPDGTRLLGVHSSPGSDHGDGLHPRQNDETVLALLKNCAA